MTRTQALIFSAIFLYGFPVFSQTKIGGPDSLIFLGQRFIQQYGMKRPEEQITLQIGGASSKAGDLDIIQSEGSAPAGKRVVFPIRNPFGRCLREQIEPDS